MFNDIKTAILENRAVQATIVLVTIIVGSVIGGVTLAPGQQVFLETFDGVPGVPTPFVDGTHGWDVIGNIDARENGTAVQVGHHGATCGAPPLGGSTPPGYDPARVHPISTNADTVFQCNDHIMTATGLAGFGEIYLSPPAMLDFSAGPAVLEFDMSTFKTGSRDWPYITFMPEGQYVKGGDPEEARDQVGVYVGGTNGGSNILVGCQRINGQTNHGGPCDQFQSLGGNLFDTWNAVQAGNGVESSASRRDTFRITLSQTNLSVCIVGNNTGQVYAFRGQSPFCWVSNASLIAPLADAVWHGHAVVTITHASYNVEKSCSSGEDSVPLVHNPTGDANCPPNTWHWDNVAIAPAVMRGGAPSPTPTASPSTSTTPPSPTPIPTASPTPTPIPTPMPGAVTVTFNDLPNNGSAFGCCQAINGSYSGIDWGTNIWLVSGPWSAFTTNSMSFYGGGSTSSNFGVQGARVLTSLRALNGSNGPTTVTLSCGAQTSSTVVGGHQLVTISTGFTTYCATVNLSSTNGWDTNFDDLVLN